MAVVPHSPPPTPEQLLARFRDLGDSSALGALFDATAPDLFRVALTLTPDAAAAEDALQETYLVLMEDAARWEPSRPVLPWLAGILRLKVHEVRRRVRRSPDPRRLALSLADADVIEGQAGPVSAEDEARVRAQLESLPETYRAVALMRWRYGLDPAEIAHIRGEPPGTTRSLLSRALDRLREALKGLPAVLFGLPPPRGLSAVRESVVSAATTANSAASAAALVTAVGGGTLMAAKAWTAAAVAAIAVGGGWLALRPPEEPDASRRGRDASSPPAVAVSRDSTAYPAPAPGLALRGGPARGANTGVAPDLASAPFRGIVVDENGAPIAGARVTVAHAWGKDDEITPVPAPFVTGVDGRLGFAPADTVVALSIDIAAEQRVGVREAQLERENEQTITLVPGYPLRVLVLDDRSGVPIGGASVEAAADQGGLHWFTPYDVSTSDADGRATLLVPTGAVVAVARMAGYSVGFVRGLQAAPDGAAAEVRLGRGPTYSFRVVDARGAPVAGALIQASAYPGWGAEARSGADGAFRIEHLPAFAPVEQLGLGRGSALALTVRAEGHPPLASGAPLETPPKESPLILTLADWRVLRGRVRSVGGAGIAGATVTVEADRWTGGAYDLRAEATRTVVTGAEGEFAVERLAPGNLHAIARDASGSAIGEASVYLPAAGEVPTLEIVASGAKARLRVIVTAADGTPLAGVAIEAFPVHASGAVLRKGLTGPQGVALLDGLPPCKTWVRALPPDALGVDATVELADAPSTDLSLRLGDGVIAGLIVRLDGTAVRRRIGLTRWVTLTSAGGVVQTASFAPGPPVETDADGRFRFVGVGEGPYSIQTEHSPGTRLLGRQTGLRAGATDLRLVLVSAEDYDALRLVVDLADRETGAPPEPWNLKSSFRLQGTPVSDSEITYLEPVAGTAGRHRSQGLVPGVYDFEVHVDGYLPLRVAGARIGLGEDRAPARLLLDRGGRVEGKIMGKDGLPVVNARVSCGPRVTNTWQDGTYRVSGLQDGDVDVTVSGRLVRSQTRRVPVRAGAPALADFTVETAGGVWVSSAGRARPARSIALTLVSTSGGEGVTIEEKASVIETRFEESDKWGWSFGPLAPGRYRLEGTWDGIALSPKDVEVKDRETARVEIAPP